MKSIKQLLIQSSIPLHLCDSLEKYIVEKVPPGGFLQHVLINDLKGAITRADHTSTNRLKDIVITLDQIAPRDCWGSKESVCRWISPEYAGRLEFVNEAEYKQFTNR